MLLPRPGLLRPKPTRVTLSLCRASTQMSRPCRQTFPGHPGHQGTTLLTRLRLVFLQNILLEAAAWGPQGRARPGRLSAASPAGRRPTGASAQASGQVTSARPAPVRERVPLTEPEVAARPGRLVTCGPDSAVRPEPRPSPASGLGALSAPGPLSGLVTSVAAATGNGRAGPGLPLRSRQLTGSGQRSQGRCDPDAPTRGCRRPSHAAHPVTDPLCARHRPRNREARNHTDAG